MASLSERAAPELTECDREPIHIPGAIQPHGLLLIADPETLRVLAGAGALEEVFGTDWLGAPLQQLLAQDVAARLDNPIAGPGGTIRGTPLIVDDRAYDVAIHRGADQVIVELEPTGTEPLLAGDILSWMDVIAAGFERASNLQMLCARAATAFRALTGFDRVMVYRFLDDEAGRVVGEDRDPALGTFMHHHFPAADIPRQARALYVLSLIHI